VAWVSEKGFSLVSEDGCIIYFHGDTTLNFPFSVATVPDAGTWGRTVSIGIGDQFRKQGMALYRQGSEGAVIDLSNPELVQLDRSPFSAPPSCEILAGWIRKLAAVLISGKRTEGFAGALSLLSTFESTHALRNEAVSPLSRYASQALVTLLEAAAADDVTRFQEAWNRLLGLGQGATPSGDDLLTGFLAVHSLLRTSFWEYLRGSTVRQELHDAASRGTTVLAAAVLRSALNGIFPEPVLDLFEGLQYDEGRADRALRRILEMGHTSGTDLMTGVILGVESVRLAGA
jgi:hypothetical protein